MVSGTTLLCTSYFSSWPFHSATFFQEERTVLVFLWANPHLFCSFLIPRRDSEVGKTEVRDLKHQLCTLLLTQSGNGSVSAVVACPSPVGGASLDKCLGSMPHARLCCGIYGRVPIGQANWPLGLFWRAGGYKALIGPSLMWRPLHNEPSSAHKQGRQGRKTHFLQCLLTCVRFHGWSWRRTGAWVCFT